VGRNSRCSRMGCKGSSRDRGWGRRMMGGRFGCSRGGGRVGI
jgi:hypothetical protein